MAERDMSGKAVEGVVKTEAVVLVLAAFMFFLLGSLIGRR
jgi:hypothetical protein